MPILVARFDAINPEKRIKNIAINSTTKRSVVVITMGN
jgi:hypothetical protein